MRILPAFGVDSYLPYISINNNFLIKTISWSGPYRSCYAGGLFAHQLTKCAIDIEVRLFIVALYR